jgi:hypothetical protein
MVNDDRAYGAMPKLYGAPAYARPPMEIVYRVERPIDPDDLPLESERLDDADPSPQLTATQYAGGAPAEPVASPAKRKGRPTLRGRPFRFRVRRKPDDAGQG